MTEIGDVVTHVNDPNFKAIIRDIRIDSWGQPSALCAAGRTDRGVWLPTTVLTTTYRPEGLT